MSHVITGVPPGATIVATNTNGNVEQYSFIPFDLPLSHLQNSNRTVRGLLVNWVLCKTSDGRVCLYFQVCSLQRSYGITPQNAHIIHHYLPQFTTYDFEFLLPHILRIYGATFWQPQFHGILSHFMYYDVTERVETAPLHQMIISTLLCNTQLSVTMPYYVMVNIFTFLAQEPFWRSYRNLNPIEEVDEVYVEEI
jgi:hypothetical protein